MAFLLLCPPAAAKDDTGAAAIFIGFPGMLLARLVMGGRPSGRGGEVGASRSFRPH